LLDLLRVSKLLDEKSASWSSWVGWLMGCLVFLGAWLSWLIGWFVVWLVKLFGCFGWLVGWLVI
jgi:hypothetical protein